MNRRVKALLLTATLWATAWALVGVLAGLVQWQFFPYDGLSGLRYLYRYVATYVVFLGATGALCGLGFALLLSGAERDRSLAQLSTKRMALWGALAGTIMPLLGLLGVASTIGAEGTPPLVVAIVVGASALMGAGAAAGSLSAARKVELLPSREASRLSAT